MLAGTVRPAPPFVPAPAFAGTVIQEVVLFTAEPALEFGEKFVPPPPPPPAKVLPAEEQAAEPTQAMWVLPPPPPTAGKFVAATPFWPTIKQAQFRVVMFWVNEITFPLPPLVPPPPAPAISNR